MTILPSSLTWIQYFSMYLNALSSYFRTYHFTTRVSFTIWPLLFPLQLSPSSVFNYWSVSTGLANFLNSLDVFELGYWFVLVWNYAHAHFGYYVHNFGTVSSRYCVNITWRLWFWHNLVIRFTFLLVRQCTVNRLNLYSQPTRLVMILIWCSGILYYSDIQSVNK